MSLPVAHPKTFPWGSDGSAASGGESDLSEWQRSARDEGGNAKDIRRAPQQEKVAAEG